MRKNKFPPMQFAAHRIIPGSSFFTYFVLFTFLISCSGPAKKEQQPVELPISAEKMHDAGNALRGLDIFEGLHITVMATEPMLRNPTNIDVDERGRVWVTEAYNYRPAINGNPTNPEGDRIIILQDNNGDGVADTSKIFYQVH